jgi:hypothetical protein
MSKDLLQLVGFSNGTAKIPLLVIIDVCVLLSVTVCVLLSVLAERAEFEFEFEPSRFPPRP